MFKQEVSFKMLVQHGTKTHLTSLQKIANNSLILLSNIGFNLFFTVFRIYLSGSFKHGLSVQML